MPKRSQRRAARRRRLRVTRARLAVALLALVAFLYYRPITSYVETRAELDRRAAEVRSLQAERRALERGRAEEASARALGLEARKLSMVRPGERLFIVSGVAEWRRAHDRASDR